MFGHGRDVPWFFVKVRFPQAPSDSAVWQRTVYNGEFLINAAGKTISKSSAFKDKPIPWMYTPLGSMLAIAVIKLTSVHRQLTALEVTNIRDFFDSEFVSPRHRHRMGPVMAFWMTYVNAIRRMAGLSRQARQDYFALQRQGCFAVKALFDSAEEPVSSSPYPPILIVPGLNTPPVFFREMHEYFTGKGYPVSVMNLPKDGFANITTSAEAMGEEIERLKARYNASRINVIGHCLGGLIAHHWLENADNTRQASSIQTLVSLGTGFLGSDGVRQLKTLWIERNTGKPIPVVFDELIEANMNTVERATETTRHSVLTIWDFMVHFRKGLLEVPFMDAEKVVNHVIEDPAIDHLTLALNHRVFQKIESLFLADQCSRDIDRLEQTV